MQNANRHQALIVNKFRYFTSTTFIHDRMSDSKDIRICEMEVDDDNKLIFRDRDIPRPSLVDAVCLFCMSWPRACSACVVDWETIDLLLICSSDLLWLWSSLNLSVPASDSVVSSRLSILQQNNMYTNILSYTRNYTFTTVSSILYLPNIVMLMKMLFPSKTTSMSFSHGHGADTAKDNNHQDTDGDG